MRSAQLIIMVTFAETTHVSPMELREPACVTATLSPGLRRKKRLWQNAVKHIMIQQELSAQVSFISIISRFVAFRCLYFYYFVHIVLKACEDCVYWNRQNIILHKPKKM